MQYEFILQIITLYSVFHEYVLQKKKHELFSFNIHNIYYTNHSYFIHMDFYIFFLIFVFYFYYYVFSKACHNYQDLEVSLMFSLWCALHMTKKDITNCCFTHISYNYRLTNDPLIYKNKKF